MFLGLGLPWCACLLLCRGGARRRIAITMGLFGLLLAQRFRLRSHLDSDKYWNLTEGNLSSLLKETGAVRFCQTEGINAGTSGG